MHLLSHTRFTLDANGLAVGQSSVSQASTLSTDTSGWYRVPDLEYIDRGNAGWTRR